MDSQTYKVTEQRTELKTRELARKITNQFCEYSNCRILYDLSKVEFISRSFADEFYKKMIFLQREGVIVKVDKAQDDVLSMFLAVHNTQNSPAKEVHLQAVRYNSFEDTIRYLKSILD
jgi:hypothetical protein